MKREIIITVGCPGSGKTTWARAQDPTKFLTFSLDEFRTALFGSKDVYWNRVVPVHGNPVRSFVWRIYARALDEALLHWPGHVIICNTALEAKTTMRDFPIFSKHGIEPRLLIWDMPLEALLERNRGRPVAEQVSEEYLERCHAMMHAEDAWWKHSDLKAEYVRWKKEDVK